MASSNAYLTYETSQLCVEPPYGDTRCSSKYSKKGTRRRESSCCFVSDCVSTGECASLSKSASSFDALRPRSCFPSPGSGAERRRKYLFCRNVNACGNSRAVSKHLFTRGGGCRGNGTYFSTLNACLCDLSIAFRESLSAASGTFKCHLFNSDDGVSGINASAAHRVRRCAPVETQRKCLRNSRRSIFHVLYSCPRRPCRRA